LKTGVRSGDNLAHRQNGCAKTQPRFSLCRVVATLGALEALRKARQSAAEFVERHARGDWGDVCEEDRQLNDEALIDGSRLLFASSAFHPDVAVPRHNVSVRMKLASRH
jgi:hypothetical protein